MYEAFVFMCTPNISIYVGMMSGTSMDGVDAVACVFNEKGCQFIARSFEPYSDMLRESLLSLCRTGRSLPHAERRQRDRKDLCKGFQ